MVEKRNALSKLRTAKGSLAVCAVWSVGGQQVSLAFLTFEGAVTVMMQDLDAMLSFLSSLCDVTEGC